VIGLVATVRNRGGMISGAHPFPITGNAPRVHLVDIECNGGERPFEETLLWERERSTTHTRQEAASRTSPNSV
jgi:hypothetical protein